MVKVIDVYFSTILISVEVMVGKYSFEDLYLSIQETIFVMLTKITGRCLTHCESNEVLVVGGMTYNIRLQQLFGNIAVARGAIRCAMDDIFFIDNGTMIAYTSSLMKHPIDPTKATIILRYRINEVIVDWD